MKVLYCTEYQCDVGLSSPSQQGIDFALIPTGYSNAVEIDG